MVKWNLSWNDGGEPTASYLKVPKYPNYHYCKDRDLEYSAVHLSEDQGLVDEACPGEIVKSMLHQFRIEEEKQRRYH